MARSPGPYRHIWGEHHCNMLSFQQIKKLSGIITPYIYMAWHDVLHHLSLSMRSRWPSLVPSFSKNWCAQNTCCSWDAGMLFYCICRISSAFVWNSAELRLYMQQHYPSDYTQPHRPGDNNIQPLVSRALNTLH